MEEGRFLSEKKATEEPEPSLPPLADSPYAVESTTRRERWWFSGGAILDQGPTPASVGFVCTMWLADRGVISDGASYDQEFARTVQADAQRVGGQLPGDENAGAFLWAGVEVLRSRGLVESAYDCPGIDTVVNALLERGPILAGCEWRDSLFVPHNVGGRMVCRLDPDGIPRGRHAVLLNGISLDEDVGGSEGLVRFKNSWGRGWGDNGQAFFRISDLAEIMGDHAILLIPPRARLGPEARQDEANEEAQPQPLMYGPEAIGSDLWTTHDAVGYGSYADAIARGIQHAETRPPLTIGIKAPWGGGKTSLMRMIQQRLEWPQQEAPSSEPPRPIHLVSSKRKDEKEKEGVTNGSVLRALRDDSPTELLLVPQADSGADPGSASEDTRRSRPTVWFNPWMFQTADEVWAGLAHSIITQTTQRMSPVERERFWLALNRKRIDEQAVRRKIYSLIFERVLPAAIGLLATAILGLVLITTDSLRWVGTALAGGSPLAFLGYLALQARSVLSANVAGHLAQLVGPHGAVASFAHNELRGAADALVQQPDYQAHVGSFYLLHTDLERVLDLVATPERPLVVFIDDLDRCSPKTVVQVIEAINLFLAGELKNTIFVIAMEPEIVVAHVEAAYVDLLENIRERAGDGVADTEFGWRFLEKFIQLPLTLPGIDPTGMTTFFESLFPVDASPPDTAATPTPPPPLVTAPLSPVGEAVTGGVVPPPSVSAESRDAFRRRVDTRLLRDSAEIRGLMVYATKYLDPPNPREIKRFVNLFRFFVMIHTERIIAGLPTAETIDQLTKLALVGTRWPSLVVPLMSTASPDTDRSVLQLLEQTPRSKPASQRSPDDDRLQLQREALAECDLAEATLAKLLDESMVDFLAAPPLVGHVARFYL